MKKLCLMLMVFITCLFTSCLSLNQCPIVTSATVTNNNYRVLHEVEGRTTQVAILGIGGASRKLQERNAVDIMYANANLKPGQAIINVNVNCTQSLYVLGIVMTIKTIARGTVIEYLDAPATTEGVKSTYKTLEEKTIDYETIDIDELVKLQSAPHHCIGDVSKLSGCKSVLLTITGVDSLLNADEIANFSTSFRQSFRRSMSDYNKLFSLKDTMQDGELRLIITAKNAKEYECYAQFFDRYKNNFVSYY